MTQVRETAKTQAPFAAIVGCIDSRVPPELVFDQRIGDVFCARIAGNFINDDIIGSLEFATQVSGARAIVVLGHSSCGAIKGAIDGVKLGHLTGVLAHIRPAVSASKAVGKPSSKNDAFVQAVAETNARMAVATLTKRSPILKALAEKGELRVAAAMHDLATGRVSWLS
jgi:carbonic anhydrase